MYRLGLDIGGTKAELSVVDDRGRVVASYRSLTGADFTVDDFISMLKLGLASFSGQQFSPFKRLGICFPGIVNPKAGTVLSSPNLQKWHAVPLAEILSDEFDLTVGLDNDANCAAIAEAIYGAGRGYVGTVLYVTISTGIGGGVVVVDEDGHYFVLRGQSNGAVEIGHFVQDWHSPLQCGCRRNGHWESLGSGGFVGYVARIAIEKDGGLELWEFAQQQGITDVQDVGSVLVGNAAEKGIQLALDIVHDASMALSKGLIVCCAAYNPGLIVIGGGAANLPGLVECATENLYAYYDGTALSVLGDCRVVRAQIDNPGVVGASLL